MQAQALAEPRAAVPADALQVRFRAVLCGSFRRDPTRLTATFDGLRRHYDLLSPSSVQWEDPAATFVRLPHEAGEQVGEIEGRHLAAIRRADFVWLFAPDGYVGTSAALEVGFARSAGVPVMSDSLPDDPVLASMVTIVGRLELAGEAVLPDPGIPLAALQDYYDRIAERRGWDHESPRDTMLLLTEEVGELARAVRRETGLARDGAWTGSAAEELADLQLYVVHLANTLGIDLARSVTEKEAINAKRVATERAA